jgi:hypothetical protein
VTVVVLDACRTNPFAQSGAKGVGGDKGLAPPPQVKGVFSIYAASNGQSARDRLSDDDSSPNSVFSRVLVPALTRPGIDLAMLAIEVREEVARIALTAGYDQRPAYYDETTGGRVYLAGLPAASVASIAGVSPLSAGPAEDEVAWTLLKDAGNADQLRLFIAQYPASPRRREAEERLKTLESNVAVPLPIRPAESTNREAATCKAQAADRKLWGPALIGFMAKCGRDSATSCAVLADERPMLPLAKLIFIRRCVSEAVDG